MINKLHIFILLGLLITATGCVREPELEYPNTPKGNLEALWHIIDEKYCFVEEKNVDWDGVWQVYQHRADTLKQNDIRGLFRIMAQMLDTLQDGHVNLYSSFDVSRCSGWYDSYPANYNSALLTQYMGTDYQTAGSLYYNKVVGHDKVGYIRYTSFSNSFGDANMYYVLSYFSDCKGIIVDVRQNGGGDLTNAYKLASTFMEEDTHVGYWQHKTGTGHNDFSALEPIEVKASDMRHKWLRPVVVVTNRHCYSATNSFVNCMRYVPYATIVGGKTGGGGGMPLSYDLPNGWMVRFSSIRMTDRDKKSIEEGIAPDVEVTLTSSDKDDILEKAIEMIED